MSTLDKLSLKWGDFQNNVTATVGLLRTTDDFTDVTLACENGEEVRAHKIILAASSHFFQKLLSRNKHVHPIIYMRGIKSEDLSAMVDFMYFGETDIDQDNLEEFLRIAKEFNVKGLHSKEKDLKQESNLNSYTNPLNHVKEDEVQPITSRSNSFEDQPKMKKEEEDLNRDNISKEMQKLSAEVNSLMIKGDTIFYGKKGSVCRECGKEGSSSQIKSHIEVNHIDGIVIPCNSCDHTFRSRQSLRKHNAKLHTGIQT